MSDWEYLRKSQAEEDDPEALAKHHALLTRVAEADGHKIPAANMYQEIGSAEFIDARPAFLSLLGVWERLSDGAGGRVYVTELSRLSRGLLSEQGRVEDVLMRKRILIRTPARIYNLNEFEDRLAFHCHGLIANAEYELTKQRFANGKRELLLKGRIRNARVPFGYDWIPGESRPRVIPDECELLRLICQDALTLPTREIGKKYGLKPDHVRKILTNPMICGWPAERYRRVGRRKCILLPRAEWTWPNTPGDYPTACSREEWEAIQDALKGRERGRERRGMAAGWCRDVVRWEGQRGRAALGTVNRQPVYEWTTSEGKRLYVARSAVHDAAERALEGVLRQSERVRLSIERYVAARGEKRSSTQGDAVRLATEVERLRRMDAAALARELSAEADGDREELARLMEARGNIKRDLARATVALEAARTVRLGSADMDAALRYIELLTADFTAVWADAEDAQKRIIARAFLEEVTVRTEKMPGQQQWTREVTGVKVRDWWLE